MVVRIRAKFVVALIFFVFLLPVGLAFVPNGVLVQYSFDDGNVETGPDTFSVFEAAKGTVELSSLYRYSGYQSVEIRDVADDQNFPELQGYFPLRKKGMLYAHFSLLITNPHETLNIALAGPKWFTPQKDGIAFRLSTRNGFLYHHSDSIPKKLFLLQSFVWYVIDVKYDITRGRYDLVIHREGDINPLVQLASQANATNSAGSAVDKFSFIGDTGTDVSNTIYYVDDILIGTDENIVQQPFVAPGRRKLFFDMWHAFQKKSKGRPVCLPAFRLEEFGITTEDYVLLKNKMLRKQLNNALSGDTKFINRGAVSNGKMLNIISAISSWNRGCRHLSNNKIKKSIIALREAYNLVPDSILFRLSYSLAKAAAGRGAEAEADVAALYGSWPSDSRLAIALAMIGMANAELYKSKYALRTIVENPKYKNDIAIQLNRGSIPSDYTAELGSGFPLQWRQGMHTLLVSEQYFMVLLWQGKHQQAFDFAFRRASNTEKNSWLVALWYERAGDAAYLSGDNIAAINLYETSMAMPTASAVVTAKLSDLYYLIGDLSKERELREKIFGTLRKRQAKH